MHNNTSTSTKKVVFVITQSEMGGAQRFLVSLLLNTKDLEALVVIGMDGDGQLIKELRTLDVPYMILDNLRRSPNLWADFWASYKLRRIIKSVSPTSVFLLSSKAGFVGSIACRWPFRLKTSVIYRIGGWTFNDPWPAWKRTIWIWLEKLSAKWKDIIILNNNRDLIQAKKLNISARDNIIKISNGIDPYRLDLLDMNVARIKLSKTSGQDLTGKIVVGTIANFYPTKDLRTFIDVANHLRDVANLHFVAIGDGTERSALESKIESLSLTNITLTGKIPNASQLLSALDIFVLTSVKEGFPWALLEAMAAKVPVIATDTGAVTELITDGENGFVVQPGQSMLIADKIRTLIKDSSLNKEFRIKAHQTVLKRFEQQKMIDQTLTQIS